MAGFSYPTGACACSRDKCSYDCETYSRWNPKPVTNADRIRAMSDEDLAEYIRVWFPEVCPPGDCPGEDYCYKCWLDWLRQEAAE